MRTITDRPPRGRPSRGRIGLLILAVAVIILILSLRGIAGFYTDYLWFASVHFTSVFRGVVVTKVVLAVVFCLIFFLGILASLTVADRLAPAVRSMGPEDEFVQRYRDTIGPHAGKVRLAISVIFALLVGTGASGQWNTWIEFRNAVSFGVKDPLFHKDVGFFVFRLPFYSWLLSWVFLAVVVITIVTAVAHYLNGGIRPQASSNRFTPQVKAHLSVLLAVLALLKAIGYYLQRFRLDLSTHSVVDGALYTQVKAQLPALTLLSVISIVAMFLLVTNIWMKGWVLPALGVGLWALVAVIIGVIYPAFIQKFRVQPNENALERPYLQRNMSATTAAYGIGTNQVQVTQFHYKPNVSATNLNLDAATVRNIRLWDPTFAAQTYQKLQEIRSYYNFPNNDLSIDRYMLNGKLTQTLLAVRQLDAANLPQHSWVNLHLQYTHGYGAVLSPANAATIDGNPVFNISNVPPVSAPGTPVITQPDVYFGLGINGFVIANTKTPEIDYQSASGSNVTSSYTGDGGVQLSSFLRRAAFAIRFGDLNTLISSQIKPTSRILFVQDIQQEVAKAAPFLRLDSAPYATIVNGQIEWIQDAYTSTADYPYSQLADTSSLPPNSGLNIPLNYVRNSVKVEINAYTGQMKFYVMDPSDPIIQSYEKAFPGLFTPGSKMPMALRKHLRYPGDLFRIQTAMYGRYHITNINDFYNAADAWNVSQSAGVGSPTASNQTVTTDASGLVVSTVQKRMAPQYVLVRLPGQTKAGFILLQTFVPASQGDKQQNLSAFMVAECDPSDYGQLKVYEMPPGASILGPALVDAQVAADPAISEQISLLDQHGSNVELGNLLVIPIQHSLVYVRPLYVESSTNPQPKLDDVIVASGTQTAMAPTLQAALAAVFGSAPPTLEQRAGSPTVPTKGLSSGASQDLAAAAQDYQQALNDLQSGNLGAYQQDVNKMGQAIDAANGQSSASTTTTTTLVPNGT
ncbi:MAG: UPF0182 family membrane protein [Acidimicrobiales bacterium]